MSNPSNNGLHWSDCALNSLPARLPQRCDCGGFPEPRRDDWLGREVDVWHMRYLWWRESKPWWVGGICRWPPRVFRREPKRVE